MIVGVIGKDGFAKKIIQELQKKKIIIKFFYHPFKKMGYNTNNLNDLLKCDAVFILSPIDTHYKYLNFFLNKYKGYIYCEKPMITKKKQSLAKINHKLFMNLNFNFSSIKKIFSDLERKFKLGKPLYMNIDWAHGLSFKKKTKGTWRFQNKKNTMILNLAVHFIDFYNNYFNINLVKKEINIKVQSFNKKYDTCFVSIISKVRFDGFFSYSSCCASLIRVYYTNAIIIYDGAQVILKYPRDNFDKVGNFLDPKIRFKKKISNEKLWSSSISDSLNYFLAQVEKNKKIDKKFNFEFYKLNKLLVSK